MLSVVERKPHVVYRQLGIVFGALSGALLVVAAVLAVERWSGMTARTASADGVVVAIKRAGHGGTPVVEFHPAPATTVRIDGNINAKPPAYRVGEHVTVRYAPAAPEGAIIDTFWEKWFLPFIFGTIALPYLVLATIFTLLGRRGVARERDLRDNATRVSGKVVSVERARAGKRRMHKLIVEARDPSSGEPRRFASNPVAIARPEEALGQAVTVLVDASRPSRFLVDLSEVRR